MITRVSVSYFYQRSYVDRICLTFQACTLKRIQKHPFEGDALSQSDSTTYYEDLLSCSDNSTDEGKRSFSARCVKLKQNVCFVRDESREKNQLRMFENIRLFVASCRERERES